jgi:hypothetical protein
MQESEEILNSLLQDPDNNKCCDCRLENPRWASVSHGIFICLQCAGIHRGLGVQISFVRSLTLDTWNKSQLSLMSEGGNRKFLEFMDNYGLGHHSIKDKYITTAASYYRKHLKATAYNEVFEEEAPRFEEAGVFITAKPNEEAKRNVSPKPAGIGKFTDYLENFSKKVKDTAKEVADKPQILEIREKTQEFIEKVNITIQDAVQKTKESETFQSVRAKSSRAFTQVEDSAKKWIGKFKDAM